MRRLGTISIISAVLVALLAVPAAGSDALLAGDGIKIRSGSTLSANVSGAGLLPSGDDAPTAAGASLIVFDIGDPSGAFPGAGGAQEIDLPASGWSAQLKKGVAKGYVYVGAGTTTDPCTSVKITPTGIQIKCQAGITLSTPFQGDAALILSSGEDRYCATWGGSTRQNNAAGLDRSGAQNVGICPAARPGRDTVSTLTPHWGQIEVIAIPVLINDYAPNPSALRVVAVTQPVKGSLQFGKLTIADDGRSLVYDMAPPECVSPLDPAYDPMLVCCPVRLVCDEAGIEATYTVSDGVTRATQRLTLNIDAPDEILFDLVIGNLYYPDPNEPTELYVSPPSSDLNIPRPVSVTAEQMLPVLSVSTIPSLLQATFVVQGTCPSGSLATICDVTITAVLPGDSPIFGDGFSLSSNPLNLALAQPLIVDDSSGFLSVRVLRESDSGDPAPSMHGYFGPLTDLQRENCWVDQRLGIREVC